MKLLQKDLKVYKLTLAEQQDWLCPVSGDTLQTNCHLDHCHKKGNCRAALSPRANRLEGKVVNSLIRLGFKPEEYRTALIGLLDYWDKDFSGNPIHPKHLSPNEKELKKLKKLKSSVKKPETKAKYDIKIKEVQALVNKEKENCWRKPQ